MVAAPRRFMNIKHIIIVILIIIVFLLIMIGKGNDKIDKDVTKAVSQEAGISTGDAAPEQKAETSNEDSEQQEIEKSISPEAKSGEEAAQHISGKPMTAPDSIEEKDQHISGVPTPEKKSAEDQNRHISGQ